MKELNFEQMAQVEGGFDLLRCIGAGFEAIGAFLAGNGEAARLAAEDRNKYC